MYSSTTSLPPDNSWDTVTELKLPENEDTKTSKICNTNQQTILRRIQNSTKALEAHRDNPDKASRELSKNIPTPSNQDTQSLKKEVATHHNIPNVDKLSTARQNLGLTPFEAWWRAYPVAGGASASCVVSSRVGSSETEIRETKIDRVLKWRMEVEQQCRGK